MGGADTGYHEELSLSDYLGILRRRWLVVVGVLAVVVGLAAAYSLTRPNQYRSSSSLLIETSSTAASTLDNAGSSNFNDDRIMETEVSFIIGGLVADAVADRLDAEGAYSYSASTSSSANVITVSATADNPEDAATVANAVVDAYIDVRAEQTVADFQGIAVVVEGAIESLDERLAELDSDSPERSALESQRDIYVQARERLAVGADLLGGTRLRVITSAEVPEAPFAPQPIRNIVLGSIVGLILGVGAALLRETLDTKIRNRDDLSAAGGGIPVVAEIPRNPSWKSTSALLSAGDPKDRPVIEAYRSLATALRFITSVDEAKVVQVTSAAPGEGKTTTIANLALALAAAGERVVLVDADLRKPRIDAMFGRGVSPGLTNVLAGTVNVVDALHRPDPNLPLVVLGAGTRAPNPAELLASKACGELFRDLARAADVILVDSPPVLAVADPRMMADKVDVYVLVARADVAKKNQVRAVIDLLHQVDAKVAGTVLSCAELSGSDYYGYYGTYGDEQPKKAPKAPKPPKEPRGAGRGDEPSARGSSGRTNVEDLFPKNNTDVAASPIARTRQI